jgi:hypothetical protein
LALVMASDVASSDALLLEKIFSCEALKRLEKRKVTVGDREVTRITHLVP